jgi:hypothetical protein
MSKPNFKAGDVAYIRVEVLRKMHGGLFHVKVWDRNRLKPGATLNVVVWKEALVKLDAQERQIKE